MKGFVFGALIGLVLWTLIGGLVVAAVEYPAPVGYSLGFLALVFVTFFVRGFVGGWLTARKVSRAETIAEAYRLGVLHGYERGRADEKAVVVESMKGGTVVPFPKDRLH